MDGRVVVITLKNQTSGVLNYINGAVSVAANSNLVVSPDYWVVLFQDSTLITDYQVGNVIINDGVSDYNSSDGFVFSKFDQWLYTPLATVPLYYSAPVAIRQSAATASGGTVWAMRNPVGSTKIVFIESVHLLLSFDAGTPLGRSLQKYDLVRFSAATPTAGTSITPVSADSTSSSSAVTDVRFLDTGLTTTSVSFGNALATMSVPASDGATTTYVRNNSPIRLMAGEGLCIRLNGAAVVGQGVCGDIIWSER